MNTKKLASQGPQTKAIHSGEPNRYGVNGPIVTEIVRSSTFTFSNTEEMKEWAEGKNKAYIYTRYGNPTLSVAEKKIAALEGAEAAGGHRKSGGVREKAQTRRADGQHIRDAGAAKSHRAGLRHGGAQRDESVGRTFGHHRGRLRGQRSVDGQSAPHDHLSRGLDGSWRGISADSGNQDAGRARAAAVRKRDGGGDVFGEASESRARTLSGIEVAPGPRAGEKTDAGLRLDAGV